MSRVPLRPEPVGQEFVGLKSPPDWVQVFGGSTGPLELEIGCGAGGFAVEYARRNPAVRYVAFEWRKKYAREVAFRAMKHGVTNLRVIEGDAKVEVPRLFTKGQLACVHLQFPDPWWKRAHQKRAILTPQFTPVLFDLIAPGGTFELRTDVEDRALQMLAALEKAGFVNPQGKGTFHPRPIDDVPSTRERRYLVTGEPVFRARLQRP
ncbi:MAG: tRNA (guanosine(46)-N7)-methyltransferase TrmB [Myxococcaceae bacterium]|nr:tRNA (guanosine(46)-N7)-methyltransferase TrmB [Myxococcaceae bacterium]